MINIAELRYGNLVAVNNPKYRPEDDGKTMVVVGITKETIGLYQLIERKEFSQFAEFIDPIINTPDLLKQFGFEKKLDDNLYYIVFGKGTNANGLFLEINMLDFSCSIGQLNYFSHQFGEYKYLHQLQNLVFSISGQELIFKTINS